MDKCPQCNTPWTTTRLVFSDIKHCTVCNEKADVIMAKHKESEETGDHTLDGLRYAYGEQLRPRLGNIVYAGTPKSDPCPVQQQMEEQRSIREEIDALYDSIKKNQEEMSKTKLKVPKDDTNAHWVAPVQLLSIEELKERFPDSRIQKKLEKIAIDAAIFGSVQLELDL